MSSLPWDDFRLVRAIAEHRSLAGAAMALGVNNSTVFRRLNTLEEMLGVRMFERSRSGYALTSAGEEMVALAAKLQDSITDFERRVAGQDVRPAGELRVTTTDTIFSHLIVPLHRGFQQKFPEITLDFIVENRVLNLSRRDADIAVRATTQPPDALVGRRVATLGWGFYAHRALLEESGAKPGGSDLPRNIRIVGYGDTLAHLPAGRWLSARSNADQVMVKASTMSTVTDAIRGGIGGGVLPCFIGEHLPDVVRLMRVDPGESIGLWLLTHPDIKRATRVRAFLEYFGSELTKKRRLIEGEPEE